MLKSGRRRWGQMVSKATESWEEPDLSERAVSNTKKPTLANTEKESGLKELRPL